MIKKLTRHGNSLALVIDKPEKEASRTWLVRWPMEKWIKRESWSISGSITQEKR